MKKQNYLFYILTLFFIGSQFSLSAQVGASDSPCIGQEEQEEIEIFKDFLVVGSQSSVSENYVSSLAFDEDYTDESTARSAEEENAWIEFDLSEVFNISSLTVWYPEEEEMKGYYILFSEHPFSEQNLGGEIASEATAHYFIEEFKSGEAMPIEAKAVRYLRVQLVGEGRIAITEITVTGFGLPVGGDDEDCGNGIDDDCDGLVDCEDPDCGGWINEAASEKINPTCPICEDGEIHIYGQSSDNNAEYSIDGGVTWQNSQFFYNLDEGDYYAMLRNPITGCIEEYEDNPIILEARDGDPQGTCGNGDFEDGDFTDWTGGLGKHEDGGPFSQPSVSFGNTDFDDPAPDDSRHKIIQSSLQTDPYAPIVFTPPTGGQYFARLNNDTEGGKATRLTHCFTVDDDNKDFFFNFAIVLEDPTDHSGLEKPYFQYKIFEPGNSSNEFAKETFKGSDDDFFDESITPIYNSDGEEVGETIAQYRDWTCRNIDLSSKVGQEMCIRFDAADCSKGGHFGYVYIDALCTNSESQQPVNNLEIDPIICSGSDNFTIFANTSGANEFIYEICQLTAENGAEFGCETLEIRGENISIDLEAFFEEHLGFFNCDEWYRVKLTASNECFEGEAVEEDVFVACPIEFDYINVTYCTTDNLTPVVGTNNCLGDCTYEWVAIDDGDPIAFDNPNAAFPNIINFPAGSGGTRVVAVTITDENGCIYTDTVSVRKFRHEPHVSISYADTYLCNNDANTECELVVFATITTPILFEDLNIQLENIDKGVLFDEFELISSNNAGPPSFINTYVIRYILDGYSDGVTDQSTYRITVQLDEFMDENIIGCVAEADIDIGNLLYWGDIPPIYFPNAMSPNGDGTNDEWIPMPEGGNFNTSWYKFQIWHEWGGLLYEEENCAPIGGFNTGDISWDGVVANGQYLNTDWYIYIIYFENCNNVRPPTASQPFEESPHPCPTPETCWYGEFYYLR